MAPIFGVEERIHQFISAPVGLIQIAEDQRRAKNRNQLNHACYMSVYLYFISTVYLLSIFKDKYFSLYNKNDLSLTDYLRYTIMESRDYAKAKYAVYSCTQRFSVNHKWD